MKKQYWSSEEIDNIKGKDGKNCRIKIVLGQKGNGKSFNVKYKILKEAYENPEKNKFAYFRLFKNDISDMAVNDYFRDMQKTNKGTEPIKEMTNGEWDRIKVYRGEIFFAREETVIKKKITAEGFEKYETTEIIKSKEYIGRAFAVNTYGYQSIASRAYPGMKNGIFEEFVSTVHISDDIPDIFMKEISTIFRDREDTCIYMLGNRVSRINPFITSWNLHNILKQKEGTIDVYSFEEVEEDGEKYTVNIAVESCLTIKTGSKIIFGSQKKSIEGNQYDTKSNLPLFRKNLKDYDVIYEVLLDFQNINYILRLVINPNTGDTFVFGTPFNSCRKVYRKISDKFDENYLTTNNFNVKIKAEAKMVELINNGKIIYSDSLTGTEIPTILKKIGGF